jgi:hypothetical protein
MGMSPVISRGSAYTWGEGSRCTDIFERSPRRLDELLGVVDGWVHGWWKEGETRGGREAEKGGKGRGQGGII